MAVSGDERVCMLLMRQDELRQRAVWARGEERRELKADLAGVSRELDALRKERR